MAKKILILEDDEATAALIEFYLREKGFQTDVSLTGEGFVDRAAEFMPDLITIDILLPDTDGFKIFKALQEDKRTRGIPAVFITIVEEKEKGLGMGAAGYMLKPFREEELFETIKSILNEEQSDEKNTDS